MAPIAEGLEANGVEVVTLPPLENPPPGIRYPTPDELRDLWPTVDGFLLNGYMVTREALQAGVRLRTGASWVIGTEGIDVEAATDLDIVIGYGATPENFLGVAKRSPCSPWRWSSDCPRSWRLRVRWRRASPIRATS